MLNLGPPCSYWLTYLSRSLNLLLTALAPASLSVVSYCDSLMFLFLNPLESGVKSEANSELMVAKERHMLSLYRMFF